MSSFRNYDATSRYALSLHEGLAPTLPPFRNYEATRPALIGRRRSLHRVTCRTFVGPGEHWPFSAPSS